MPISGGGMLFMLNSSALKTVAKTSDVKNIFSKCKQDLAKFFICGFTDKKIID